MIRGVLIDIAGVLTDGPKAIDGALTSLERLSQAGLPFRLVTNTTRRSKRRLVETLSSLGFDIAPDHIFTPAQAAIDHLRAQNLGAHLLIHPGLDEDFAAVPRDADAVAVVVGDAGRYFDYDRLNAAFRRLMQGAPFLALAANRTFRDADGEISLDAGAFVHALEFSSGVKARILGKPAPDFFRAAAASMGLPLKDVAMIGDDAEADIAGARTAGAGAAYLVRTGKFAPGDDTRFTPPPTETVADITEAIDRILA